MEEWRVADSDEFQRDHGACVGIDVAGKEWLMTVDEAPYWPGIVSVRRLVLVDGYWVEP